MSVDEKLKLLLGDLMLGNLSKDGQIVALGTELRATKDALKQAQEMLDQMMPSSAAETAEPKSGDGV